MKKILLGFTILFFSVSASANNCATQIGNISGLDKATAQELTVQCEQKKLDATNAENNLVKVVSDDGIISTEKLSVYGKIAQEFAKALGIAAKELGIAVDEFLGTTAGKLTAIIIIYKVMGDAIIGVVIGVPLLLFVWYVGYRLFKFIAVKDYENHKVTKWYGDRVITTPTYNSIRGMSESETGALWFIGVASVALTIFILFAIIT